MFDECNVVSEQIFIIAEPKEFGGGWISSLLVGLGDQIGCWMTRSVEVATDDGRVNGGWWNEGMTVIDE